MEKTIIIDGKEVKMKSSAAVPRMYRKQFGRDIFKDMMKLKKDVDKKKNGNREIPIESLEMFENVAYVMAKHADWKNVPNNIMEWMEGFETFSIYEVLPEIMSLWDLNNKKLEDPKKNSVLQNVK